VIGLVTAIRSQQSEEQMSQQSNRVELQIWREAGAGGMWRCRVVAPDGRHTVRLDGYEALSAYVASQINLLVEGQEVQTQASQED
jgi:hypothetical protein